MDKEKEKKKEIEHAVKSLTREERMRLHIDGIKKTVYPAFISAVFAAIFLLRFQDPADVPWFPALLFVGLLSYYIQRFLYPPLGINVREFGVKDWLYVEFLIIIYFIVFWTLLLNE